MAEFSIITNYFANRGVNRKDVILGIGDDCAITTLAEQKELVITTDTLVAGVHFPKDTPARAIAHKAVAVNVSDLAAMGAEPGWLSLAITLPEQNEQWLEEFSAGLFELADYFNMQVIGGDTTQGPLSITITAQGMVPQGTAMRRDGASNGDWIYVTGHVGDAAAGLELVQGKIDVPEKYRSYLTNRLHYPSPRVLAGQTLRGIASAGIDVSDGLLSDLKHILNRSGVGAKLNLESLPLSEALIESVSEEDALRYALCGGDDYELIFTVPEAKKGSMDTALSSTGVSATCIGQITASEDKLDLMLNGEVLEDSFAGFEHFKGR